MPAGGAASPHLASRLAVERILLDAGPCSVALRASIVIGAGRARSGSWSGSSSGCRCSIVPPGGRTATSPIDERDMVELLARAATSDAVCGESLDAAGPELVSYGELIDRIREHMLVGRPTIGLRRLTLTPIASRVAALIAGEDHELIGPLMESLENDLLPARRRAAELLGVRLHSLDAAIERALREWEATEPLRGRVRVCRPHDERGARARS